MYNGIRKECLTLEKTLTPYTTFVKCPTAQAKPGEKVGRERVIGMGARLISLLELTTRSDLVRKLSTLSSSTTNRWNNMKTRFEEYAKTSA